MHPTDVAALLTDAAPYRPTAVVSARQLPEAVEWRSEQGVSLQGAAGDWELTDDDGDRWTVEPAAFARSYRRLPNGRYAKHETVEAVRLTRAVEVSTREGLSAAQTGDWLLRDARGAVWPVPDAVFRARYRPADGRAPRR